MKAEGEAAERLSAEIGAALAARRAAASAVEIEARLRQCRACKYFLGDNCGLLCGRHGPRAWLAGLLGTGPEICPEARWG